MANDCGERLDLKPSTAALRQKRPFHNRSFRVLSPRQLAGANSQLAERDHLDVSLLKRWVRAERGQKEGSLAALSQLAAHLRQLALRLEAALG